MREIREDDGMVSGKEMGSALSDWSEKGSLRRWQLS